MIGCALPSDLSSTGWAHGEAGTFPAHVQFPNDAVDNGKADRAPFGGGSQHFRRPNFALFFKRGSTGLNLDADQVKIVVCSSNVYTDGAVSYAASSSSPVFPIQDSRLSSIRNGAAHPRCRTTRHIAKDNLIQRHFRSKLDTIICYSFGLAG